MKAIDKKGRTVLHLACKRGSLRFAKYFIRFKGADMQVKDNDGKTPLELTPSRRMGSMTLLFSEEEARRQSKKRRAEKDEAKVVDAMDYHAEEGVDEDEMVGAKTLRKVFLWFIFPFLLLLLVNGWWFAIKFIVATVLFYTAMLAYFVTEIAIRPPWYYQNKSNRDSLRMKGCPLYWQGWITDPETDLGLKYEDVHFRSTDGYTLRGWHIFPPSSDLLAKNQQDGVKEKDDEGATGRIMRGGSSDGEKNASPDFLKENSRVTVRGEGRTYSRDESSPTNTGIFSPSPHQVSRTTSFVKEIAHTEEKPVEEEMGNGKSASYPRMFSREVHRNWESVHREKREHSSTFFSKPVGSSRLLRQPSSALPPHLDCHHHEVGVVLVHGGGRDRRAWLRHSYFLHEAGYGCLLFDLREHGLSDGNMRGLRFGMGERYDVVAAVDYMRRELHYKHICVIGTSVGGSSVLMAAAIDKNIDGVISENPFTTSSSLLDFQLVTYIGNYAEHQKMSGFFFKLFRRLCVFVLNCRIGNFPSKHCESLHCIDSISPRPVMLLHGIEDAVVPFKHSEILYERAKAPKELYLFDKAYHCGLYNTDPEVYEDRVLAFLSALKESKKESENTTEIKKEK